MLFKTGLKDQGESCDDQIKQGSNSQPSASHGTHKLITKTWCHTKNTFFLLISPQNRYNFDSFTRKK